MNGFIPYGTLNLETTLTVLGISFLVLIICNSLQSAFNFNPKWLGLILSITIPTLDNFLKSDHTFHSYVICIFSGFIIFSSASGINTLIASPSREGKHQKPEVHVENEYPKAMVKTLDQGQTQKAETEKEETKYMMPPTSMDQRVIRRKESPTISRRRFFTPWI